MPEISVIVPVYNNDEYISKCIESLLNQIQTDFELLLIDDGSTDCSGKICDDFAEKDGRIKVIHKKNEGVSAARNTGIKNSLGKYIAFCDGDDYVSNMYLNTLLKAIKAPNIDLAICAFQHVSPNTSNHLPYKHSKNNNCEIRKSEFWPVYKNNLLNSVGNKLFKRSIIDKNNLLFDTKQFNGEDLSFVLKYLLCMDNKISLALSAPLYFYNKNTSSATHKYIPDMWNIKKQAYIELRETALKCNINFYTIEKEFYEKYIDSIVWILKNNMKKENPAPFFKKYFDNVKILHSKECKTAFSKGSFPSYFNPIYKLLLKSRCFLLIYTFDILVELIK